ncbi:aminopeptidase P family protein [Lewinella sp. W8]|uniref:aminopeptidase P family protein n=1 Tax=Lewinella sp. W8 TaxID=2528208 RepID=UPI0010672993|nr:aminopeptidase P family protein [Lewinella sp. W8]MTB49394.1 M24 family metallopeptidase [Lewinella sp. W8]
MTVTEKIAALRRVMLETQIDAYIIPSTDPHQSEYPAPRWESRIWMSGFTGSAGTLVVTLHEAKLWTDGRYYLQATDQLAGTGIELMKDRLPDTPSIEDWLGSTLLSGQQVGCDGRVVSVNTVRRMRNKLAKHDLKLVTEEDLIRKIWKDRPAVPGKSVFEHKPDYSGVPWQERLKKMQDWVGEQHLDYYLVAALDEIAWLLNMRGSDIDFNPLAVCYLVVGAKGDHSLFSAPRPGLEPWKALLEVHDYDKMSSFLRRINALNADIGLDPATTSARLCMYAGDDKAAQIASPIPDWKAIKNEVAINHLREALRQDAVPLLKLRRWLDQAIPEGVNEYEVGAKLTALRAELPLYVTDSFPPIVGYGPRGAIIHYRAPYRGSGQLAAEGLLLIDSGGQYHNGTTDITRTFALGPVTEDMKRHFTLVLQGHIDLAMARFPKSTSGVQLDTLARRPLWQEELNYGHGTGHGVGFFLNVHEGPVGIAANPRSPMMQRPLKPGMVLSNEPGYYLEGAYGIRTENLVLVTEGEREDWLRFETLTLFPIDRQLIVKEMLSPAQLAWVNDYHARVLAEVGPLLEDQEEQAWLTAACAAL